MLGLSSLVFAVWNFISSDWLRTAVIISTFVALVVLLEGVGRYPVLFAKSAAALALVAIPFSWYGIATYVAEDASHPVSLTLIAPMVAATVLFAYCGSRHFNNSWGGSTFMRLITSFIAASTVSLIVAVLPVMISYDHDRNIARAAAEKAFTEFHPGQATVAVSEFERSGWKFLCAIRNSASRCVSAR
jgi:hypothetical protein